MVWNIQMYLYSLELSDKANKKLEKKNIAFTKDGMKVGVKELRDEDYADKTQKYGFTQLPFLCLARYRTESEGAGSTGQKIIGVNGLTSRVCTVCWLRCGI